MAAMANSSTAVATAAGHASGAIGGATEHADSGLFEEDLAIGSAIGGATEHADEQCPCCFYTFSKTICEPGGQVWFTTGWRWTPGVLGTHGREGFWQWWHGDAPHGDPTKGQSRGKGKGKALQVLKHAPRCACCYYGFTSTTVDPGWALGDDTRWVWHANGAPHAHLVDADAWERRKAQFEEEARAWDLADPEALGVDPAAPPAESAALEISAAAPGTPATPDLDGPRLPSGLLAPPTQYLGCPGRHPQGPWRAGPVRYWVYPCLQHLKPKEGPIQPRWMRGSRTLRNTFTLTDALNLEPGRGSGDPVVSPQISRLRGPPPGLDKSACVPQQLVLQSTPPSTA